MSILLDLVRERVAADIAASPYTVIRVDQPDAAEMLARAIAKSQAVVKLLTVCADGEEWLRKHSPHRPENERD
jgi:hypothetical protein